MDNTSSQPVEIQEAEPQSEIPQLNPEPKVQGKPESYSMMDPKMRRIYGEFYREIYFTENKVLDTKTQELISIAASLVAKCQGCIDGHMKKALSLGATPEEISEAISIRSEEHTSELQSRLHLVCRLLLEKKKLLAENEKIRPILAQ